METITNVTIEMCVKVAKMLEFDQAKTIELKLFVKLHNIGLLTMEMIAKETFVQHVKRDASIVEKHIESGHRIASSIAELSGISDYILHHHAHWDGTGYPKNVSGYQIPIQSRILLIADFVARAMGGRLYKNRLSIKETVVELDKNKGTLFDPELVQLFKKILHNKQD